VLAVRERRAAQLRRMSTLELKLAASHVVRKIQGGRKWNKRNIKKHKIQWPDDFPPLAKNLISKNFKTKSKRKNRLR